MCAMNTIENKLINNSKTQYVLWLTGLPSSGKTTLSNEIEKILIKRGVRTCVLDGDRVRTGLNKDLGFSARDRSENIRRIGEVAKILAGAGVATLVAFISPYRADRLRARKLFRRGKFIEVFVKCPVQICRQRDVKGSYRLADRGGIKHFTGVSDPYEEPLRPELTLDTAKLNVSQCVYKVIKYLNKENLIPCRKIIN